MKYIYKAGVVVRGVFNKPFEERLGSKVKWYGTPLTKPRFQGTAITVPLTLSRLKDYVQTNLCPEAGMFCLFWKDKTDSNIKTLGYLQRPAFREWLFREVVPTRIKTIRELPGFWAPGFRIGNELKDLAGIRADPTVYMPVVSGCMGWIEEDADYTYRTPDTERAKNMSRVIEALLNVIDSYVDACYISDQLKKYDTDREERLFRKAVEPMVVPEGLTERKLRLG